MVMIHRREPIIVNVGRGGIVESQHRVHAVVASTRHVERGWGDIERPTMPRSAIKSIQLLPMLTSGAAAAYAVSDDEIALAASSHSAEPFHIDKVRAWLDRVGLDESALECGPTDPISLPATRALYASGGEARAVHNCCSGKHTGFLTVARHHAHDVVFALPGYLAPGHGVQGMVRDAQALLTGVDLEAQTPVVDGCGIPVFRFPLVSLAQGMARLVTGDGLPDDVAVAAARVTAVLPSRALLVSGTGRPEQVLTDAATEPVILKGGAEGVFMAALPERGIGIAMKCADGAHRAVDDALGAILHLLEVTPELVLPGSPVRNRAGVAVGEITVDL